MSSRRRESLPYNAYKDDDSLISILRSYFPSLRSNRQFTRSGWVSLTLIAILVVREFSRSNPVQHGDIGRSPSLESLSERTFTQGYPLLKKTAESQDLPVWQTARETDASGKEGQRRNPLEPKEMLKIDENLMLESTARSGAVGVELKLDFYCSYETSKIAEHCPAAYRVFFMGPTLFSPTYKSSSEAIGSDGRRVRVTIDASSLQDPGSYEIYAWPEHDNCRLWNTDDAPIQYHRLAIKESPIQFEVTGDLKPESALICPKSVGVTAGRWISKAHLDKRHLSVSSSHWWWLSMHMIPASKNSHATFYDYIYAPHACKKPHHSYREWIDIVKPKSLLFIGDSISRDLYCNIIYSDLGGEGDDGLTGRIEDRICQWPQSEKEKAEFHTTDKAFSYRLPDRSRTSTAFAWVPEGDSQQIAAYLDHHSGTPPTHISFGVALWLANVSPDEYVARVAPSIQLLVDRFPVAKIVIRTSATTVQAVHCWDVIGNRKGLEANNAALAKFLEQLPSVVLFDVYSLFNNRPDSTSEGRHWSAIGMDWQDRPETGAAEYALGDEMMYSWLD